MDNVIDLADPELRITGYDDLIREINESKRKVEVNFIKLGVLLKKMRDSKIYKERFNTFSEFIEKGGIGLSRGWVYSLIKVVERYKQELGWSDDKLASLGCGKAATLLRLRDPQSFKALAERASNMSLETLREAITYIRKDEDVIFINLSFKVTEERKNNILRILEKFRDIHMDDLGDSSLGQLLEFALVELEGYLA